MRIMSRTLMAGDASTSSGTSSADVVGLVFEVGSLFRLRWRTLAADILTREFQGEERIWHNSELLFLPRIIVGLEKKSLLNLETRIWLSNVCAKLSLSSKDPRRKLQISPPTAFLPSHMR